MRAIARMPHRDRMRALLDRTPTGAEVPFLHGLRAVAVRGLPEGRQLVVHGEPMPANGPDADRLRSVWVEVEPGEVAPSQAIGHVLVDRARLMFADADALSGWNRRLADAADLVFWGRDAEAVAARMGASRIDDGGQVVHGWRDLPGAEAIDMYERLEREVEAMSAMVRTDLRPHNDDHRILADMRRSAAGAGSVEVEGREVCGFFTSWGDGAFPVHRDLAADGRLLRIRVELGAPEIVARARRMEELWFGELSKIAVASPPVAGGERIRWLERRDPVEERDSGWCLYSGTETQEELDRAEGAVLMPVRDVIARQPEVETVLPAPAPAAFEFADDGTWTLIEPSPE